ncbi:MAG: non-canonical purine NTP pyrophosphatase, partial [Lactobacillus sp.]|nr:non-canonical purine NTP pyrophosphatase [Lactobacillus sp.]
MTKKILFATNNQGKVRELKKAFDKAGLDVDILTNSDLDNAPHVVESGRTFEANAKLKA